MAWYVYIIECRGGSLYTGVAVDVARRFALHVAGKGAKYTRSYPPTQLLAAIQYPGRSQALKSEYAIKQLSPAEKRLLCQRHQASLPLGQATETTGVGAQDRRSRKDGKAVPAFPAQQKQARYAGSPGNRPMLKIGDTAPKFSLAGDSGKTITSASLKGKRYLLYFYPKDNTPGCTREACAFRDNLPAFDKLCARFRPQRRR